MWSGIQRGNLHLNPRKQTLESLSPVTKQSLKHFYYNNNIFNNKKRRMLTIVLNDNKKEIELDVDYTVLYDQINQTELNLKSTCD